MRELLIATRNEGKMPEIRLGLKDVPFKVIDINDVSALAGFEPHESGSTYEENAMIKAKEYGKRAGLVALADDSGIEVDALGGEPGVGSARYAPGTDADRNQKLLEVMKNVPDKKRGAKFVCVIAIFDPTTGKERTCCAEVFGTVTREPRGARPFGYDPVFLYDEANKTGGEMTLEEKDKWSHRGRALAKARDILIAEFS